MSEIYVDPDALSAVSEVARRQHDHVGRVSDYIASECSRFGAFSAVLNLFEGSYRSAVESALGGMRDGQTIATKVDTTVAGCREDFLDTDRESYDRFAKAFSSLGGLPPYTPPGGGDSTAGGPLTAPPAPGETPEEGDPFKLKGPPPYIDGPLGRMLPNEDQQTSPLLDPKAAAQDAALERIREEQRERRYLEYREQGMSPEDALDRARRDIDLDRQVQESVDRTARERTESAYDEAHDRAKAEGKSDDEAREAGHDAAREQHSTDSDDTRRRGEVAGAAGTYKDGFDAAKDTVDKAQELHKNIEELRETQEDLDKYDDYENRPDDESAQDWARR